MKKKTNKKSRRNCPPYKLWIMAGALLSALVMLLSLFVYIRPALLEKTALMTQNLVQPVSAVPALSAGGSGPAADKEEESSTETSTEIPYLESSSELGQIHDINIENTPSQEDSTYTAMLNTSLGPMLYYNQADSRWGSYLYGSQDPMKKYGCGPTVVAMLINSFSSTSVTPVETADWAAANGCHAPQGGSYHSLIEKALTSYGIPVESIRQRSAENAARLLDSGHILIALMGKGALTDNGHFILITEHLENGNVRIADPNSYENSTREWDLNQLLSELKQSYDNGAPLWAVSLPKEG